jgi:RNA exonuclease 4
VPHGSPSPVDNPVLHGDTVESLRSLIFSPTPFSPDLPAKDRQPGQYIALDCEMVGVGPMGTESTLARVSVVNYFGAVLMDEFVQQKERVTDWRTQWSGVRAKDMINGDSYCLRFCMGLQSPHYSQRRLSKRFKARWRSS